MGIHKAPWEPPGNPWLTLDEVRTPSERQADHWGMSKVSQVKRSQWEWGGGPVWETIANKPSCAKALGWGHVWGNLKGGVCLSYSLQRHQCLEHRLLHSSCSIFVECMKRQTNSFCLLCSLPAFGLSGGNSNFLRKLCFSLLLILSHKGREFSLFHLLMNF